MMTTIATFTIPNRVEQQDGCYVLVALDGTRVVTSATTKAEALVALAEAIAKRTKAANAARIDTSKQ